MRKYHLIGIKGTGMSALAVVLKQLGNDVKGSDNEEKYFTEASLIKNKIQYFLFDTTNINSSNTIYIISSCYNKDNVEVNEVINNNYTYYYYHEFIEFFFQGIRIGVSGSHGKTTTTSFITSMFKNDKICSIVGDGSGIGMQNYDYLIFEACEYKSHILSYHYDYLIINNIDVEHLDYFRDEREIYKTFYCASKQATNIIVHESVNIVHDKKYVFGKSHCCFCYYDVLEESSKGYKLMIYVDNKSFICDYNFTGEHMINNLLASIVIYYLCHNNIDYIEKEIANLKLPKRRMEEYYYNNNILIDDYAHHPTEIEALIKAVKQKYPDKKIIVFFQPHTYSRTLTLLDKFKTCFNGIDELYVDKTFTSKREVYNSDLEKKVLEVFEFGKRLDYVAIEKMKKIDNVVMIFLGAGVVNKYINTIIK